MKTFLLSATYLVGAGELLLAVYFWITNSKNEIRRVMAFLAFVTGMWVVLSAATSYVAQTTLTTFYMKLVFVCGVLLVTALLHLILFYPVKLFRMDVIHTILLYVPAVIFSVISLFSNAIVNGFIGSSTESGRIISGQIYSIYNLYLSFVYLACLVILLYRLKSPDGVSRTNLSIIFWSIMLGGLPAVFIDLLIPVFSIGVKPNALFANLATVIWLGATTYVVRRRT